MIAGRGRGCGGLLTTAKASATKASVLRYISCALPHPHPHRRAFSAENGPRPAKTNGPASRNPTSAEAKQKRELDREFLISVLESSATKRDAKAYLQTFGSKQDTIQAVSNTPRFVQGPVKETPVVPTKVPYVALVKLRDLQTWDDRLVDGVAKTLTQLQDLGLPSVIVLDCEHAVADAQTDRILHAIGRHSSPGPQVVAPELLRMASPPPTVPSVTPAGLYVGFKEAFLAPLGLGRIVVVPPRAYSEETLALTDVKPDEVVLALASFFSGLQFHDLPETSDDRPLKGALVERIIVIDPLGGLPSNKEKEGARVFINLEEEFPRVQDALCSSPSPKSDKILPVLSESAKTQHLNNLRLVKSTLALLPPTASAVITSPAEAANVRAPPHQDTLSAAGQVTGSVGTRRWQNPLIHNLLTDRPIYSSSLPIGRIKPAAQDNPSLAPRMPTTTLAKRGMPVTIFPDPRDTPWRPPKPGGPRLRLTDTCVDLPRLVHLINDSFSRQLDVEHYLRRVQDSLAGIIIAGEYEGGAILTWERPCGMDEAAAYEQGRLVPYLDKFAVLKKSQGAGGVADIVFNAMVRDCFPRGVCWRSRKDNPVNKWYFERSAGVRKLGESNWAMFWTNADAALEERLMRDYEDVCRNVEPSWADGKQAD
ncbi:mitochondrial amino-acid acetyltransferase [Podospora conica]|nr:mitochondrial amino-acid acetyltransferase [Schizothecium conicum]